MNITKGLEVFEPNGLDPHVGLPLETRI
uniref:Uncharacterized protein n=1 Tax=mine drainage metagenome TaxID=410659 RepID=E6QK59_9ZZZZ